MNNDVKYKLKKLYIEEGIILFEDIRRLNSYLMDILCDYKAEKNVLSIVINAGILAKIINENNGKIAASKSNIFIDEIVSLYGLSFENASWAVESLIFAVYDNETLNKSGDHRNTEVKHLQKANLNNSFEKAIITATPTSKTNLGEYEKYDPKELCKIAQSYILKDTNKALSILFMSFSKGNKEAAIDIGELCCYVFYVSKDEYFYNQAHNFYVDGLKLDNLSDTEISNVIKVDGKAFLKQLDGKVSASNCLEAAKYCTEELLCRSIQKLHDKHGIHQP